MARPICTKDNPAPEHPDQRLGTFWKRWRHDWDHPDTTSREIDEDHGDIRYHCPNCNQSYVAEGPDA